MAHYIKDNYSHQYTVDIYKRWIDIKQRGNTYMIDIFEKILLDQEKMAQIKDNPFCEAAFFSLYNYVKDGRKLSELSWFTASALHKHKSLKKAIKLAA